MKLLAVDDLVLSDLGIAAESTDALLTDQSQFREWGARSREGASGSVFFGNAPGLAIWAFTIQCPDIAAQEAVFAALSGDEGEERRLLAQRLDAAETRVVARAAVRGIRLRNEFDFDVDFEGQDSVWTAEIATETEKTFTSELDQAMPLTVPGNTRTAPRIILIPTEQRASQTAAVGYTYRRRFTITNTSDTPWFRLPVRVDLGSTTAHVTAGRAQADGDDVRLVSAGIEQERTLVTWNSAASFLWFILPNLQPGDSITYDILSGNPSAVSPPVLAYPNLPPFTLASSSNASWVYPMSTNGAGAWRLSRATAPAAVDFTIPGAWRRILTLDNPDNPDWSYAAPYHPPDALAGAAVQAKFRAERHPAKYGGVLRSNAFDGVGVFHPLGISSITANFMWTNPNDLGTLVILARESAADPWTTKHSHAAVAASATSHAPGAQAFSPAVQHVACAVWPDNGWEMPPDSEDGGAIAWWNTALSLAIDTTDLDIEIESGWTEVYEFATTLRLGGGGNAVAPYRELLIGNADGEDGAGTPRATVTLAQGLQIDCDAYTHEVWSQSGGELVAFVEGLSAHSVAAVEGWEEG